MKKTNIIIALLSLSTSLIAQTPDHQLRYSHYTQDVSQQDTTYTLVRYSQNKNTIHEQIDLKGQQPIPGLATETYYIDYDQKTYALQLEYPENETYLTQVPFSQQEFTHQGKEKINNYNCEKYTTSINSNTIEIWITHDLDFQATPMAQFAHLGGVMIKYRRNGSSITELTHIKKEKKKTKYQNMTPSPTAKQVTYRELDNISKNKKVLTTNIFFKERIHFGDTTKHTTTLPLDTTIHFANGTIILKKINLQHLPNHYQYFLELTTQSSGDAYDRTGSIFLIPQDKTTTFYHALSNHIDQLPYFTSKKGNNYQGMHLTQTYTPLVELMRFFTPFGVGHFNDRVKLDGLEWEEEVYYKQEITNLAPYLQGEAIIGAFIGNYDGGGHLVTLDLKAYPGDYTMTSTPQQQWIQPLFNTCNVMEMAGQNYPHFFDTDTLTVTFEIPEGVENPYLRYITTGHGGWGGGDEFNPKPNHIIIDDTIHYQYTPWREDCGRYREWNPVSGNFFNGLSSSDLSRSGWCPGTATQPTHIYLPNLTPGTHTIKITIPQGQAEGGSFSAWSISGIIIGEKR